MSTTDPSYVSSCSGLPNSQPDRLTHSAHDSRRVPGDGISAGCTSASQLRNIVTWILSDDDRVRRVKSLLWTAALAGSASVAVVAILVIALVTLLGVSLGTTSAAAGLGAAFIGQRVVAYRRRKHHSDRR